MSHPLITNYYRPIPMLSVISFNTNSIRQRIHQLSVLIEKYNPDFIGIQETKVTDEDFPVAAINELGYHVHFHGQKTHYGVALLSKHEFLSVEKGFPHDTEDSQRRIISGRFASPFGGEITVINCYFPQGECNQHPTKYPNKKNFYAALTQSLNDNYSPSDQVFVMVVINFSTTYYDIVIV